MRKNKKHIILHSPTFVRNQFNHTQFLDKQVTCLTRKEHNRRIWHSFLVHDQEHWRKLRNHDESFGLVPLTKSSKPRPLIGVWYDGTSHN